MRRSAGLLWCLLLMPLAGQADEAWPRAWTPNVSGPWRISGCPAVPDGPRALEVRQSGHHLTGAGAGAPRLDGEIRGHDVWFSVSDAQGMNCLPGATRLRFDGVAQGARIVGLLQSADDASQRAAVTIALQREFMLSFDDGPLPGMTDRVLDALRQLHADDDRPVRAAFFTVGDAPQGFWERRVDYAPYELWTHKGSAKAHPELIARILAEGHALGNHTAHHAWFRWPRFAQQEAVAQELRGWEAATPRAAGRTKLFRPPYLIHTEAVRAAARQEGYQLVLGETVGDAAPGSNVASVEWRIAQILETRDTTAPTLLIFHDLRPVTAAHLREIVEHLIQQGYRLVHFDPQLLDAETLIRPR